MTEPTNLVSPEWAAERNLSVLSRDDLHAFMAGVIHIPNQNHAVFVGRPGDGKASSIRRSAGMLQAGFLEIDLEAIRQGANPDGSLSIGGLAHVQAVMTEARSQGNAVVLAQLPENFPAEAAREISQTLKEEARQTSLEDRKVLVTMVANQDAVGTPAFAEFAKLVGNGGPITLADIDPSAELTDAHIARFSGFLHNPPSRPLSAALLDRMRIVEMPREPFGETLRSRVGAMDTSSPAPLDAAMAKRFPHVPIDKDVVDRINARRAENEKKTEVPPKGPAGPTV